MRIILASASPRRRELLAGAGFDFDIEPADVDETPDPSWSPEMAATRLAERKARTVAERNPDQAARVVGSDTVVAVTISGADRLLGKPSDADEARASLRLLSDSRHRVVTGVAVVDCATGRTESGFERTWVTMRALTNAEIETYVRSGEWRDKAGGYAIQENADAFVTRLEEGGFDNVVGLPVGLTSELLARFGSDS